jgi:hypothetical protein
MLQAWIDGKEYIFFGSQDSLFRFRRDTAVVTDVSKATAAYSSADWSLAQWGDWVLASNGAEVVQVYKESVGNFDDLATDLTPNPTSSIVRTHRAYAVLLGTDAEGREVRWSDEDDVNTYSAAIDNAAGSLYIRDLSSPIRAAVGRDDGIIFYGDSTMHLLRWTGPPYYFGSQLLTQNVGALGQWAVVSVRNTHFGLGLNGLWAAAPGQEPQYIASMTVHNYVYNDLDLENGYKSVAWYDDEQDLVIFSYPSLEDNAGEPSRSVALTLGTGGWTPLDFAATAAAASPVLQYTSVGDSSGGIYFHGLEDVGGGLPTDAQSFVSLSDVLTIENDYGLSGYGMHGYGGRSRP